MINRGCVKNNDMDVSNWLLCPLHHSALTPSESDKESLLKGGAAWKKAADNLPWQKGRNYVKTKLIGFPSIVLTACALQQEIILISDTHKPTQTETHIPTHRHTDHLHTHTCKHTHSHTTHTQWPNSANQRWHPWPSRWQTIHFSQPHPVTHFVLSSLQSSPLPPQPCYTQNL